jgi:putative DNA primase/helicase
MALYFEKTRDSAKGKWRGILIALGMNESYLKDQHGPCPLCRDGKDRFRFDDKDGDGTYYCNQCGAGSGSQLVQKFLNLPTWESACKRVDSIVGTVQAQVVKAAKTEADTRRILTKIWKEAVPVKAGDPVWKYLESRCGDPSEVLADLRYHPGLKHPMGGVHPAMLALCRPNEGKAAGIHRTFLTMDGGKADVDPVRMMIGECATIRLGPVMERMGIAEGIETAISAGKMFGCPVWSAISANGLKSWMPPEGVRSVVVCGDADQNYTGQEAAYALAHHLAMIGLDIEVQIPGAIGTDWNDHYKELELGQNPPKQTNYHRPPQTTTDHPPKLGHFDAKSSLLPHTTDQFEKVVLTSNTCLPYSLGTPNPKNLGHEGCPITGQLTDDSLPGKGKGKDANNGRDVHPTRADWDFLVSEREAIMHESGMVSSRCLPMALADTMQAHGARPGGEA